MATPQTRLLTYDDINSIGDDDRIEVIDGEIVPMAPTGWDHSDIAANIVTEIKLYLRERPIGRAASEGVGLIFNRNPLVMVAPDAAFIRNERLPPRGERQVMLEVVPDFAAEVISPSDRANAINDRIQTYMDYGTRLLWIVDPKRRIITIYDQRDRSIQRIYREGDEIDGGEVLPGFRVPVTRVFE